MIASKFSNKTISSCYYYIVNESDEIVGTGVTIKQARHIKNYLPEGVYRIIRICEVKTIEEIEEGRKEYD